MYNDLYHEVPWRQRSDVKNGESFLQPRLTAWYGDFPYSYSGVRHDANTEVRFLFFVVMPPNTTVTVTSFISR